MADGLTAERVRALLDYDKETGAFTWRPGHKYAGKVAGSPNHDGYIVIGIDRRIYRAHRDWHGSMCMAFGRLGFWITRTETGPTTAF